MKKALLIGALVAVAGASFAQQARVIQFTAFDNITGDHSSGSTDLGANFDLNAVTTVNVYSYLYLSGYGYGSTSNVFGWGDVTDHSGNTQLDIYHNETLTLTYSGFGDVTKDFSGVGAGGSHTGDLSIPTSFRITASSANTYGIPDTGFFAASSLNSRNDVIGAGPSGGHATFFIDRRFHVTPGVGPGIYTNTGVLHVGRT